MECVCMHITHSLILTTGWFDIIYGKSIHTCHFRWLRLLLFVTAHGECILWHLNKNKISSLPLFPHGLAYRIQMATVLHVQRFIHAACNFYSKILVRMIFNNGQSMPFGCLKFSKKQTLQMISAVINPVQLTFDESGVGRNVTLPISLSSSASMPGFSVYNFTLTTGSGCVVVKSPWVSHLRETRGEKCY